MPEGGSRPNARSQPVRTPRTPHAASSAADAGSRTATPTQRRMATPVSRWLPGRRSGPTPSPTPATGRPAAAAVAILDRCHGRLAGLVWSCRSVPGPSTRPCDRRSARHNPRASPNAMASTVCNAAVDSGSADTTVASQPCSPRSLRSWRSRSSSPRLVVPDQPATTTRR